MNFRLPVLVNLIFISSRLFGQTIPKDWFEKDHLTDSVAGISLDKAYELLKDRISKTVIVAVIDNGVDTEHEYLKNNSYGSPYYRLSRNLTQGTHEEGIIAADRNNDKGIKGIVDNVLIMPITATTAVGDERDKDIANAIHYAVDNGARIINMSFSKMFSPDKRMVDEAITYAKTKNVLIVHEAGNDGMNIDSAKNYHYPVAIFQNGKR